MVLSRREMLLCMGAFGAMAILHPRTLYALPAKPLPHPEPRVPSVDKEYG